MIRKILLFFGIYNLEKEGQIWVRNNIGEEWVDDFTKKYNDINRGIPIGNFVETAIFLDMIEKIRQECNSKCWKNLFRIDYCFCLPLRMQVRRCFHH